MHARLPATRGTGLLLGAAICMLTGGAEAQEYCVACAEPPAVYRCVIEGARPGGKQPLQALCVTAMTKEGRHASCAVKGGTVFDCNGPVKKVSWAAYNAAALPVPKQEAPPQPTKGPDQPPETVDEMAKRAGGKAAEQLKQANDNLSDQAKSLGQNVGDASKKTWQCIASFFTRCGE